jgi:hypothetical protein
MTIRLTRPRDGSWAGLDVYLDDAPVAHLSPGMSVHVHGTGATQQLTVKLWSFADSNPLEVRDPGENQLLGVMVNVDRGRGFLWKKGEATHGLDQLGPGKGQRSLKWTCGPRSRRCS